MPRVVRVTISGLDYNQVTQNVLHFRHVADPYNAQAIAAEIIAGWIPNVQFFSKSNFSYRNVLVQDIEVPANPTASIPINMAGFGASSTRAPSFWSAVIKIQTPVGGRHGRGRIFLAGLHADAFESGILGSLFQTQALDHLNALIARYGPTGTSDLRLVVLNRVDNSQSDMVNLVLRPIPGIQRRRNIGIGI